MVGLLRSFTTQGDTDGLAFYGLYDFQYWHRHGTRVGHHKVYLMRPGGGKQKGSALERLICKRLSLWVSDGKREDLYWRAAASGGRATVGARTGKDLRHQAGDICAVHPEGHKLTYAFYIECKHVKKLALDQFLIKGTGPLANYWKICKREAQRHERSPVIIARQNGWPILWIIENDDTFNGMFIPLVDGGIPHVSIYDFEHLMRIRCPY